MSLKDLMEENRVQLTASQKHYLKIKRVMDIFISLIALITLSPFLLIITIYIKLDSPREKVLFKQTRVGQNYKTFKLIKFRSMKSNAPHNLATNEFEHPEQYITSLGKFLRRTSIDELPQLWNVLKGDMSLIGPRPLIFTEREIRFLRKYYGLYQVKPGITGLAQINGRDVVNTYQKVYYDREYLYNLGFMTDVKLIFKTIKVVLKHIGYREGKTEVNKKYESKENYILQQKFAEKM